MFEPAYSISDLVVSRLSEIAEVRSMVQRSPLLPTREAFLRRAAVIKMAHTSTSIEGNQLEEYQVQKLAEGSKVIAETDQIREVENYLRALSEVDQMAQGNQLGVEQILTLHKLVVTGLVDPEKTGKFRSGPVYIVNVLPKGAEELAYTPPKSEEVPGLIQNLLTWLESNPQIHPIIKAGLFHYQFESIHPFTDGNGRTGRLLTLLYLYQSGWDFKKVLVLEDYYNQNRKAYYTALQTGDTFASRRDADLTAWLEYYVEGFAEEVRKVKDQILNLSIMEETGATRNILDNDELKMVDFTLAMGRITSSDVVDILKVPKRTAQAKLKRLEDIRVLHKEGAGPATYYVVFKAA